MNTISRAVVTLFSLLWALCGTEAAFAQVRAQFAVDVLATCQRPAVKDVPIHVEGTGILKTDGSARVDVDGGVLGREQYATKLGKSSAATGGYASLRVTSRSSLRATRDYPNHQMIIDMHVTGKECVITVRNVLKPGKREYAFVSAGVTAYCEKPRIVRTACQAF
ncbi:hypothetical protein [Bradyrhizobium sp.]|uniref:hypothetical protein n=1 Tax=Bradyrhizobium sp. TaxID=376 RepID=UPI00403799AE